MSSTSTSAIIPDQSTLKKLKVPELKDLLSSLSLPLSGKKEDLVQRLTDHSTTTTSIPSELEFEELTSPMTKPTTTSPVRPPSPSKTAPTPTETQKIPESDVVVKPSGFKFTKLSFGEPAPDNNRQPPPTTKHQQHSLPAKPISTANTSLAKSGVSVTSPVTPEDVEKRKQRAARFGLPLTEDVKRADRAKRFGDSLTTPVKVASLESTSAPASTSASASKRDDVANATLATTSSKPSLVIDAEVLKRRQERFGSASSSEKMSPLALSEEEKKRKRAEKFGMSSASPKTAEMPGSPEKKIKV